MRKKKHTIANKNGHLLIDRLEDWYYHDDDDFLLNRITEMKFQLLLKLLLEDEALEIYYS